MKRNPLPPDGVVPIEVGNGMLVELETTLRVWAAATVGSVVRLTETPLRRNACLVSWRTVLGERRPLRRGGRAAEEGGDLGAGVPGPGIAARDKVDSTFTANQAIGGDGAAGIRATPRAPNRWMAHGSAARRDTSPTRQRVNVLGSSGSDALAGASGSYLEAVAREQCIRSAL
jgi:hypothetical protein